VSEAGALLTLRDVTVSVQAGSQTIRALDGVSLSVRRGDRVGVMGASGAGKSTLLQVLCRLTRPTSGALQASNECGMPSLVFQFPEYQLFSETVAEDVGYGLRQSGAPADAVASRVAQSLRAVGLPPEEFSQRVPFHLSGGEQRRVALAGALAQRRVLVLFDEPTLGLDASGVADLRRILDILHQDGIATWIASHDADFLASTCDRLLVLDAGRVAWEGDMGRFWEDPDRAGALGVQPPLRASLAASLRQQGIAGLPPLPGEDELLAALERFTGRMAP
jgi:energy-coupling factor transport system ATP-binding protein